MKAAFVYNFAKFVGWPADALPSAAPLHVCIGDRGVADAFEQIVAGRPIGQHPVVVLRVGPTTPLRACHVLYLGDLDVARSLAVLAIVRGAPVLSMSDFEQFTTLGGVAHLFVQDGKMRFAINVESAQRARLRLSSRLLNLATIVKDGHAIQH